MAEDFFIVLYNILKGRPEVSDIHCVNDAKVPLMRFKFEGVAVDFPYAQFQVMSVPENFQSLLRCIKFWAKHRGVYGNLFGLIHLAVLSAFVCQRSPDAYLSALVMSFFNTFASWPWPTPVLLQDGMMQTVEDVPERRSLMPIGLPCIPYQYCQSNITQSTFNRIRAECLRGQNIVKEVIFKIYLVACVIDELGDWVGWVKSRFPSLILKLEEIRVSCDPNPTEYVDTENVDSESSVVFYWGLNLGRFINFEVTSLEKEFRNNLSNGYKGVPGKMEMIVVPAAELPTIAQFPARINTWRIPDYDQQRVLVYSRHLPSYFVGYAATGGDHASL